MVKHRLAENFRGLYSPEIDSMIDAINELTNKRHILNEKMTQEERIENFKEYFELTCEIDDLFDLIYQRSNECED